eukprot:TRINITY_DN8735_c0_g2_i1.p1 TRINITY_DN8735_c0_g2~~TRINITY_DN8735_c0_g2_i1.p1  ORF type:complete len:494 (-),score=59.32 TRINITY_DN8735_c0_g2_i1:289-1770(-)
MSLRMLDALLSFVATSTVAASGSLRGAGAQLPETLLPPPALTIARGLFAQVNEGSIGNEMSTFACDKPGPGTVSVASGPGGCLNAQPGIAGFSGVAKKQTIESFLVKPCGVVAPHTHANAVEVNTVVKGSGIIAQLTTNSNELQVSEVKEGDSFFFAQGSYHWWINLGTEQLLTVGAFFNTDSPDAALMGYDEGAGIVGSLMPDQTLLHTLIGQSTGRKIVVPFRKSDSPLFPMLNFESCAKATQSFDRKGLTPNSFQMNPFDAKLFQDQELESGDFSFASNAALVRGMGGGLRPLAGQVSSGMPFVTGDARTHYNGGLVADATPHPAYWPGLTNVGGGLSLVKFVVGYCGLVSIHTHVNAAEWNTVLEGEGQVSYYQVNVGMKPQTVTMNVKKGDTFVFPQGSAHWWVNHRPDTKLVTVGGFTAPFPDTSLLEAFLSQTASLFPQVTDAVLGAGFTPASQLERGDGANTLFPLLPTRSPSDCGGERPCTRCV